MDNDVETAPHARLVAYFVAEFMIRTVLPVVHAFDNDYEEALIFLVITSQNIQNLMLNQVTRRQYASYGSEIPAGELRPVSRMAIARSTNLPRETVRRKVLKLIARGYVEEAPNGLIARPGLRTTPLYMDTVSVQESNLRRLFSMVRDALAEDPETASALFSSLTGTR